MFEARYEGRMKAFGWVLIGALIWLASLLMILAPSERFDGNRRMRAQAELLGVKPGAIGRGYGWLGVVLGAASTALAAGAMTRSGRVALRIDERGIYQERWSASTIPWSSIAEIKQPSVATAHAIIVTVKDPTRYPPRGLFGRLSGAWPLVLTAKGTDRSAGELEAAIRQFLPPDGR